MAKKMRKMRSFARTASKSMEKKLVENAKKLKENPFLVLPEYHDRYSSKYFDKIKNSIDRVSKYSDDSKKLEKLSNKKGMAGAVAGTLMLVHSEKAPYLAVANFATGDVAYAKRGKADKEKLIATQHFDDPVLRLLGIRDIAQKKKLHVYSWNNGFLSTGLKANPPKDFVDFVFKKNDLKKKDNIATCKDINPEIIRKKQVSNKNYILINWKSANISIAICESCAKQRKNTLFDITKYMLAVKLSDDFSIDVIDHVLKKKDVGDKSAEYIGEYLSGDISDYEFIKKSIQHHKDIIKESDEKLLVLDGVSYGTDVEGFISALKPNKYEKEGLMLLLKRINEPVIFDDATPNKVLEKFWKEQGISIINELVNDSEMAKDFHQLDDTPSNILELVLNYKERQKILSKLPKYKNLPTLAKFIDNVTRTCKTFGEKKAIAELKKRPDTHKGKSIAYAFLLYFGKESDKKWQYLPLEIEYGEFLQDYIKRLVESKPEDYHDRLKELLAASGSSENIDIQ
jgi:hypothetical protein